MGEDRQQPGDHQSLRRYFWQPPRAHGELIHDRGVSFLELFYDLVYVVVIAQAAHHLAEHVTVRGVIEFAVIFGMIWIAWLNGTIYHDSHGREDGRTRTFVFLQMGIVALLGVYAGNASGADGQAFAFAYTAFMIVLTWLWYAVQRQDDPRWYQLTSRYLFGMVVSVVVVLISAFLPDAARLTVWAFFVAGWAIGSITVDRMRGGMSDLSDLSVTDELVERFGLFTIIVLGEVVVGVVNGIAEADGLQIAIVTGMVGLAIGFAFWWTYFDFVGGRAVSDARGAHSTWMIAHLPMAMGIAATGAAMISLIEHAADPRSPAPTAWLLTGATTVSLMSLLLVASNLKDYHRLPQLRVPLRRALTVASVLVLGIGAVRPKAWILAASVALTLTAAWFYVIKRYVATTTPDERIHS